MTRRELLTLAGSLTAQRVLSAAEGINTLPPADYTLTLARGTFEIGPKRSVKTVAYGGRIPGPLLRMAAGKPVTVEVINETNEPEMVHWHGLHIPPEVDGAHEEGTPMVQGHDSRRYTFTPGPEGTRWYHAHAMAGHTLTKGTYTGQFGVLIVEPRENPARYDIEVPIVLHEWEGYFSADNDMDVNYRAFSINGKMLGHGEPIRVKAGQKALFRIVNASATMGHRLALPGHTFYVVALDGNPVVRPGPVPVLELAPGERVDAIVEMNAVGKWIFGEEDQAQRTAGAGIVVEYAGSAGAAQWVKPARFVWDYLRFGTSNPAPAPAAVVPLIIEPGINGNLWAVNGKSYPNTDPFFVVPNERNRLIFDNRSSMAHPVHLHRHTFEITRYAGKTSSGVFKDVVVVPARSQVEVDLVANTPGPSLFHCHQQFHMDFGFMAVMQYRS